MRIPLYNIFGDNYILQLATEAENAKRRPTYVEIEEEDLTETLKLAAEIAEEREKSQRRFLLPLSENDNTTWNIALRCYNFPQNTSLSQVFRGFSQLKRCYDVTPPSFIKPEYYEFGRYPGRVEKGKIRVAPHYIILSAAGWVLTRVGRANVGGNQFVGVNVFSPQEGILYSLDKELKDSLLPGVKPETAFSLWISKKIADLVGISMPSFLRVYIMTDATLNRPTVIRGGFTIEVSKILSKKRLLTDELEEIAAKALKVDSGPGERLTSRNFYIKLANYIYEYINGSKKLEDLIYFANRDLLINVGSKDETLEELKRISSYVNEDLLKEMR